MDVANIIEAAKSVSDSLDADVFLFNSPVNPATAEALIDACRNKQRRKNVVLVLVTEGGSADAAYRIARCMQHLYEKFYVFVPGWCKSAGTLVCLGAHHIYMSDFAELGPLDVQLSKTDELWEYNSGLTVDSALEYLRDTAFSMFETYFMEIKKKSGNRITFKTATDISTRFVVELLKPVYDKIDPEKVGEVNRSVTIAYAYGNRLNTVSNALRSDDSLRLLVSSYPTHGFVIDRNEADALFSNVLPPSQELMALAGVLADAGRYPAPDSSPAICFLDDELLADDNDEEHSEEDPNAPNHAQPDAEVGQGGPADNQDAGQPAPEIHSGSPRRAARATPPNRDDQGAAA